MKGLNFIKDARANYFKLMLKYSQSISKVFGSRLFSVSFLEADREQDNYNYIETHAYG